MKYCVGCDEQYSDSAFYYKAGKPNGSKCKECIKVLRKLDYVKNPEKMRAKKKQYYEANKERIKDQERNRPKDYAAEYRRYVERVGREQYRKECRERQKLHYARYPEHNREKVRRTTDKERKREYQKRYKEAYKPRRRELHLQNPHKERLNTAMYRAAKRKATPPWASLAGIEQIFAEAQRMQADSLCKYDVDHIVPLQSDHVCGLHCEQNLRVVPASDNRAKNNLWWPDMPEAL